MSHYATLSGSFYFADKCLFRNLELPLAAGKWTCLLGTSGVGKSTLLRLFAGLPTGGHFDGQIISDQPLNTAFMAQSDLLFPWLNVRQNVMLGEKLRGENSQTESQKQRTKQLINDVGLADAINKRPHELSGGMRQRTALARTLMEDTELVLLDEPFSALDSRTRHNMQTLAYDTLKTKTVLLVTHDPFEALRLADHLYVLTETGLQSKPLPEQTPLRDMRHPSIRQAQLNILDALTTFRGDKNHEKMETGVKG